MENEDCAKIVNFYYRQLMVVLIFIKKLKLHHNIPVIASLLLLFNIYIKKHETRFVKWIIFLKNTKDFLLLKVEASSYKEIRSYLRLLARIVKPKCYCLLFYKFFCSRAIVLANIPGTIPQYELLMQSQKPLLDNLQFNYVLWLFCLHFSRTFSSEDCSCSLKFIAVALSFKLMDW